MLHLEESPHKCPTCGRTFNQRSNLKTHLLTHTHIKPYSCSKCGKVFRRNCDLRRHSLTHGGGAAGARGRGGRGNAGGVANGGDPHFAGNGASTRDDVGVDGDDEEEDEDEEINIMDVEDIDDYEPVPCKPAASIKSSSFTIDALIGR